MNSLFLYNPVDLDSQIRGGVQLCSSEFLLLIKAISHNTFLYPVKSSRSLLFRLLHRFALDNYMTYKPEYYRKHLKQFLITNSISHVFINRTDLMRFSKVLYDIKEEESLHLKIIILSHGNESGDLLHDLSRPISRYKYIKKQFGQIKLGQNLVTESYYRHKYIDLVCTLSEEEMYIEKWLGAKRVHFIPRILNRDVIKWMPLPYVAGFVGTLNHTPNIEALIGILNFLHKSPASEKIEIHLVGQPQEIGDSLQRKYDFVKYLGPLNDQALRAEASSWSLFLNPIFWYSKGASMKLGMAISWGIPILSTEAGRRGYSFVEGNIRTTANNINEYCDNLIFLLNNKEDLLILRQEVLNITENSNHEFIALDFKRTIDSL